MGHRIDPSAGQFQEIDVGNTLMFGDEGDLPGVRRPLGVGHITGQVGQQAHRFAVQIVQRQVVIAKEQPGLIAAGAAVGDEGDFLPLRRPLGMILGKTVAGQAGQGLIVQIDNIKVGNTAADPHKGQTGAVRGEGRRKQAVQFAENQLLQFLSAEGVHDIDSVILTGLGNEGNAPPVRRPADGGFEKAQRFELPAAAAGNQPVIFPFPLRIAGEQIDVFVEILIGDVGN